MLVIGKNVFRFARGARAAGKLVGTRAQVQEV
jgi:hypothetical protein